MAYTEINEVQGSLMWLVSRCGKFTGSEIHKLIGMGKRQMTPEELAAEKLLGGKRKTIEDGFSEGAKTYILEKVAESLCNLPQDEAKAATLQHGKDYEPIAKHYYQKSTGLKIVERGLLVPDWCEQAGSSPDGEIEGKNAGIEIKCPFTQVEHLRNLMIKSAAELKEEKPQYYWQIQMLLAVTEWDYIDYISFSMFYPVEYSLCALKIEPNKTDIEFLKSRILQAVEEKERILKIVKN